jgi:hypothetical protein
MRFQCAFCRATQWRGLFPPRSHYLRWAVIHGVALGTCGAATKILFTRLGYGTDGWRNGLASLGVCAGLLLGLYGLAFVAESLIIGSRRCRACGRRGLVPASGRDEGTPLASE